jgi:branched-chain amino acid transport system substrate-binding protein
MPSPGSLLRRPRSHWFLLIGLLLFGACRGQGATGDAPQADGIAIGVALNPQRPGMRTIYNGVELAIEQLNREREARGTRFVIRKTPENIAGAVQIATMLRDDPSVVGVVGHPESGSTIDASAIYADLENEGRNAVVAISPTATSPALSGLSRWVFRVCPTDLAASKAAARFALDSLRTRRAAIIYRNDAYGKDWTRAFSAVYVGGGGAVIQRDPYLTGITDWDGYARYTATLSPDIILFPGSAEDAELAIRAFRSAGVRAPVLGGDAIATLETKAEEFDGVRYTSFFQAAGATSPEGRGFVTAYQEKFSEAPDQRAALAYDAAMIIGRAVIASGADRTKVRDYIDRLGTPDAAHKGATGSIAFDDKNDVVRKAVMIVTVGRQ